MVWRHQVTTCKRGVCSTTTLISNLTPNSEAGIIGKPPVVTPEPGTLGLLGTRLIGLAGIVRRRSARYLRIISQDPRWAFSGVPFLMWSSAAYAASDELDFFGGTFAPFFRASESPIAMACLRLF